MMVITSNMLYIGLSLHKLGALTDVSLFFRAITCHNYIPTGWGTRWSWLVNTQLSYQLPYISYKISWHPNFLLVKVTFVYGLSLVFPWFSYGFAGHPLPDPQRTSERNSTSNSKVLFIATWAFLWRDVRWVTAKSWSLKTPTGAGFRHSIFIKHVGIQ